MRVTFDRPFAEGLPTGGEHGPFPSENEIPGAPPSEGPSLANVGAFAVTTPEPWAVALSVSRESAIPGSDANRTVNVTCQFHRLLNAVRLNTPFALQNDQAPALERPLEYGKYQGGFIALPDGTDGEAPPPLFTLEHSFCGVAAEDTQPGVGFLQIARTYHPRDLRDHRVYSAKAIDAIGALGVSLVALTGVGKMRVRIRTFSILLSQ